jgi:hypothetical protein
MNYQWCFNWTRTVTPIILQTFNLPPWICHMQRYMKASMILQDPTKPSILDTFVQPLWKECQLLSAGVDAVGGDNKVKVPNGELENTPENLYFKLHGWIVLAIGDQCAILKLLRMRRPSLEAGCQPCWVHGVRADKSNYYNLHAQVDVNDQQFGPNIAQFVRRLP